MLKMEGMLIRCGRYIMSFYTVIKNYVTGKCILKQKDVCAIGSEISMYKMIMFSRHFTEYLHALKDWDINPRCFFLSGCVIGMYFLSMSSPFRSKKCLLRDAEWDQ